MPLLPTPDIQDLEDHFFGSGAFMYGWFSIDETTPYDEDLGYHFPAIIHYYEHMDSVISATRVITADDFNEGIKLLAQQDFTSRTYQDLIEDMDAADVDAIIQLLFWNEIRLS